MSMGAPVASKSLLFRCCVFLRHVLMIKIDISLPQYAVPTHVNLLRNRNNVTKTTTNHYYYYYFFRLKGLVSICMMDQDSFPFP